MSLCQKETALIETNKVGQIFVYDKLIKEFPKSEQKYPKEKLV